MNVEKLKKDAYTQIQKANYIEAIEILKNIYNEDPQDPEVLFNLAIAHIRLNLNKPALELLEHLLSLKSGFIDTLEVECLRFYLLLKEENIPDLEKDFKRLLELYPENLCLLSLYAYYLEKKNEKEKALSVFKKILDVDPDNKNALNSYAFLSAEREEDLDRALKLEAKVLKENPNNPAYLDTFALILSRLGYKDKAGYAYKKALKLSKSTTQMWEIIKNNFEKEMGNITVRKAEDESEEENTNKMQPKSVN